MSEFLREVQAAEEELLVGNVILYPTDTVWGIGCDAENSDAVSKIYRIKEREESKAMIVLMADIEMLRSYVKEVPEKLAELIEKQERPTTYILEGAQNFAPELLGEDGTIAVRIPQDEFCHKLIRRLGRPIVSTSANISGEPSASIFAEVSDAVKERVDHVVRWRQDEKELDTAPSRIVKVAPNGELRVIRE